MDIIQMQITLYQHVFVCRNLQTILQMQYLNINNCFQLSNARVCVCVCTENKCSLALTGFMLRWRENYTANALFVICLSISAASAKYTFSITCVCKMHFIWACERRIHKYVISYNFLKICTFLHTCTKIAHIDKPRYLHIIYIYIYACWQN